MKYWDNFALMFEAPIIWLTTIDTGTRVARCLLGKFGDVLFRDWKSQLGARKIDSYIAGGCGPGYTFI